MNLKVIGPLIAWAIMLAIGVMIKYFTFKNDSVWFDIAPEATLWATGILFTIAVADAAFSQAKVLPKYTKKQVGIGFEVDYEVTLPDSFEPTAHSKYLYLFLLGLASWILNIFLSGFITARVLPTIQTVSSNPAPTPIPGYDFIFFLLLILTVAIATTIVLTALFALKEVSK